MTGDRLVKIGAILLAAGGSSRLGQPKQLIQFQGKTLVRRSAEMLVASNCSPVVVVLGAELERSSRELDGLDVSICVNNEWRSGLSSTIRAGLEKLLEIQPDIDAAAITLCDQPFVTTEDIERLAAEFRASGSPIVAAGYGGFAGVPALFGSVMFDELLTLSGDKGARALIRRSPDKTIIVDLPAAAVDIDLPGDLVSEEQDRT